MKKKTLRKIKFNLLAMAMGGLSVYFLYPMWQDASLILEGDVISYFLIKFLIPIFYVISILTILIGITFYEEKEEENVR